MEKKKSTILKFVLNEPYTKPMDVHSRFHPGGQLVLNRTEWRGKEPRSCGIGSVSGTSANNGMKWEISVHYRPKGTITYVGDTKYDGWTCMMLDRKKDGTFLDGHGQPLLPGKEPVYLPFEMYQDFEFNELNFGEFLGEFDSPSVRHLTSDEVKADARSTGIIGASTYANFVAPHRQRQRVKIILSNSPTGRMRGSFSTTLRNINNDTPHLQQAIQDELTEIVSGFIEGRYEIPDINCPLFSFLQLHHLLVDCTPNERGENSRFGILHEFVSSAFLEELAIRLMATYLVDVSVVDGKDCGLLLRRPKPDQNET